MQLISVILAVVFFGLALLHLYWVAGGNRGLRYALPAIDGRPIFNPGPIGTALVALFLAGFAVVALLLGFGNDAFPALQPYAALLGFAIGAVLVLRAIGEFRYVGIFKRVRGGVFAVYDSWLYSPFCLIVGGLFIVLAARSR